MYSEGKIHLKMKNLNFNLLVLILITNSCLFPVHCLVNVNLIKNFFREKSIKFGVLFVCCSKYERIQVIKELAFQKQHITVLSVNHTNFHNVMASIHHQIGVVLDGDCEGAQNLLIKSGTSKYFDVKHHWLIISGSPIFMVKLEKITLNIDADIHFALKNISSHIWAIFDVYNPASKHGGTLKYSKIGFYSEEVGYNIRNNEAKYWKRRNMTSLTFKTMIILLVSPEEKLEDYLLREDNITTDGFSRFQYKLLSCCRNYYNFTIGTEMGKSYGYPLPNGSFDGLIGALNKSLVDFGSPAVFFREDRANFVRYGRKTWNWRGAFIFRSPKFQTSIEILLKPLSTPIWIVTGLTAVISIIIFKVGTTFEKKTYKENVETTWSLSVLFTLGAFCQQGAEFVPKMMCGRITAISIFLLSLIIYQFYSASIVSNLLMKTTNKIRDLKDLTDSALKAGCENIIYTRELFEHTNDTVLKKLYQKKIYGKGNTSHFYPPEEGLKLVKEGGYAFHVDLATAYPIIEKSFPESAICELQKVELFRAKDLYNIYPKDSPFYDLMETCFHRLTEHGILHRELRFWHPRKPECVQESQLLTFHVGLDEFYPALLILLIGITLSLIVLVCETHVQTARDRNLQRQQVTTVIRKKQLNFYFME